MARALEVKPERVKLKEPGPGCGPADHLCGRELGECFSYFDRPLGPERWPSPLLRRRRRVSSKNVLILAKRLLDRGMAVLAPAADVPRTREGAVLASGWFAVEHSALRGRLIQDRRPQNATEERLARPRLPSGEQLELPRLNSAADHVRGTVYDLKTYFYQAKRPPGTESRNVAGRARSGRLLGKVG